MKRHEGSPSPVSQTDAELFIQSGGFTAVQFEHWASWAKSVPARLINLARCECAATDLLPMNTAEALSQEFIRAFNALDMEAFRSCLAPDISLFAPGDREHLLIQGAAAVEEHFARVFAAEGPGGPNIQPRNVRAHPLAEEAALITFEFPRASGSTGRRTLVLRRAAGSWKVFHIHASNSALSPNDA